MSEAARHARLKRHFAIVSHSDDVVELRHGTWNPLSYTLRDDSARGALRGILGALDGTRSAGEIAGAHGVPRSEVEALIDQLGELQLIENGARHALDYFLDHLAPNLLPYRAVAAQAVRSVVVAGDGGLPEEVARILHAATDAALDLEVEIVPGDLIGSPLDRDGLAFEEHAEQFAAWRGKLLIAVPAAVDPIRLRALNRIALHHRFPWLHAAVDGPFVLVGPTVVPHRSSCYECLEARVLMNLRESGSYQAYKAALADGRVAAATGPLDAVLRAMTASLTAFEALNYVLTGAAFTVGKLLAIYLPTFEFGFNEVLRLPGCPACGSAPEHDDRELYFDVRALMDGAG